MKKGVKEGSMLGGRRNLVGVRKLAGVVSLAALLVILGVGCNATLPTPVPAPTSTDVLVTPTTPACPAYFPIHQGACGEETTDVVTTNAVSLPDHQGWLCVGTPCKLNISGLELQWEHCYTLVTAEQTQAIMHVDNGQVIGLGERSEYLLPILNRTVELEVFILSPSLSFAYVYADDCQPFDRIED